MARSRSQVAVQGFVLALLHLFALMLGFTLDASAMDYTYTPIVVPGGIDTTAYGINNAGQVVGSVDTTNGTQGFMDSGGSFTTFAAPGAVQTTALGINNTGQIVGSAFDGTNPTQGFLYSGGTFTPINNPTGTGQFLQASGINDAGQIVGTSETTTGSFTGFQGFLLRPDGTFTFLNVPGSTSTFANGINNAGQIVGRFYDTSSQHGFLYSGGVYSPFNVPGSINSVTEITGINNAGQLVGTFYDGTTTHSFLYSNNTFSIINMPGSQLTQVSGINDAGQIVGTFFLSAGGTEGFIASPVPLPASLWFFASGLAGLSRLTRSRKGCGRQTSIVSKTNP